ncbi:hypothetical protein H5410_032973 [Solanum commersonii]|uniref:Uncharacterized protein n=1 Tax=Solanum commersonii TaxID=4109 RepID=A0A9J5YLG2_SOLCO|nr:hypothetical protein H5410_032973 [Solanum commersonii]
MVKTLKTNHNCEDAFINPRACISTLAQYLKSKLQNNPQVALQKLQGSFLDDFNKIEAYANELRIHNFDSDIFVEEEQEATLKKKRAELRKNLKKNKKLHSL